MTVGQGNKRRNTKKKKRRDSELDNQRYNFLQEDAQRLLLYNGYPFRPTYQELRTLNMSYAAYYLRRVFEYKE